MSDAPDLEALARRYLDLWQDQMAAMAADPAMMEALSRTFALMTQGAAAFAGGAAEAMRSATAAGAGAAATASPAGGDSTDATVRADRDADPRPAAPGDRPGAPAAPAGAAAAAAAPGDPGVDVSHLLRRIAALEQRLADIESAGGDSGGAAKPEPKPKPKRPAGGNRKPAAKPR